MQVTCERAQRTPLGLEGDGLHAAIPEAITELMQTRQRGADISAGATPEYLRRRGCAWPHDRVEVLRTGLLRPEQLLPAKHEWHLCDSQVCERVEGVGLRNVRCERLGKRRGGNIRFARF